MAAQLLDTDIDVLTQPVIADAQSAFAHLLERGALSYGRAYVAATRIDSDLLLITRAAGARATQAVHVLRQYQALPDVAPSVTVIATTLRSVLGRFSHLRSALFVAAPHLTAFAVAGLRVPIVYGSGLLRRTPEPLPVVSWSDELDATHVISTIEAHPQTSAVLLANRGVLAYTDEPISKLARFVASLEESAQLTFNAQLLGGARALPADAYEQMQSGIAGD